MKILASALVVGGRGAYVHSSHPPSTAPPCARPTPRPPAIRIHTDAVQWLLLAVHKQRTRATGYWTRHGPTVGRTGTGRWFAYLKIQRASGRQFRFRFRSTG